MGMAVFMVFSSALSRARLCGLWSLHGQVVPAFVPKSTLCMLYVCMAVPRQPPISMVTITRTSYVLVHVIPRVLPSSPAICSLSHKMSTQCGSMAVLCELGCGRALLWSPNTVARRALGARWKTQRQSSSFKICWHGRGLCGVRN